MRRLGVVGRLVCLLALGSVGSLLASQVQAQQRGGAVIQKDVQAERLFVRGLTQAYLDNHEEALAIFKEALKLVPQEAAILAAASASSEALDDATTALFYAEAARAAEPDHLYYTHQLAQLQLRSGSLSNAVATYEALLQRFPNNVEAMEELAQLLSMMGRTRDALATYERLINTAGDHPQVRRQMLQLYFRLGDEAGTRESLQALIALEPNEPAPWRLLGQLHLQQNEPEEALEAFESAYEVDASDFETVLALADLYRQLDRHAEADSLLDQSMMTQGASIDQLIARAQPLYNRAASDAEAAQAATRLLERAADINPSHPDVLLMLGDLRFQQGAFAESATLLQQALDQNPRDPDLWFRAASAYLEAGNPEEAARIADEGLLLFPGQLPLLRVAGYSLMQTFENDAAIARFEEMLEILKEDEANQQAEQSEALAALGLLYARKEQQDRADDSYQQALALNPDNTLALNNYAYSLAARDLRLEDALAMAKRAVEIDRENASYLDTLGWIHFKMEHFNEARDLIGQALALDDPTVTLYDHYGDVHARLGEWETARSYWRKALDLAPDNAAIQAKLERQQY